MADGPERPRVGCCCERMSGYDDDTQRLVITRDKPHHCCPQHGINGTEARRGRI